MQNEIENYLRDNPSFRERHNKNMGIAYLLQLKYRLDIDISRLKAVIEDASSCDRYWRLLTNRFPELRGKDYDTKKIVEQRKQIDLGYESGFNEINKRLSKI